MPIISPLIPVPQLSQYYKQKKRQNSLSEPSWYDSNIGKLTPETTKITLIELTKVRHNNTAWKRKFINVEKTINSLSVAYASLYRTF